LKKHPTGPEANHAKALKALALYRTNRDEEAYELCLELKSVTPPIEEDHILRTIGVLLKAMRKYSDLTQFYENICAVQPKLEKNWRKLFFCYVREGDFKKQQNTAMKMSALYRNDEYVWWVVANLMFSGSFEAEPSTIHPFAMTYPLLAPPPSLLSIPADDNEQYVLRAMSQPRLQTVALAEKMMEKSFADSSFNNLTPQKVLLFIDALQAQV
jgi:tetratricopeptide (TPR) repeat protein